MCQDWVCSSFKVPDYNELSVIDARTVRSGLNRGRQKNKEVCNDLGF